MAYNVAPLSRLIEQFERLPGIGRKSAQRLAFYILNMPKEQSMDFAKTILEATEKIKQCSICKNLTDDELCPICKSDNRDKEIVCVVEDPRDVLAIEKTREYKGVYHVLHGVISPMDGIGPEQLYIKELLNRIANDNIKEIIIATNSDVEGEATALYLLKLMKNFGIKITRLAFGLPVGGDLQYADDVTLAKAIEGRSIFG